jgi:hypothetical protein
MIRLQELTIIDAPVRRCFDLARSVEVHLLANVHSGEQALAISGVTAGLVGPTDEVTWRARHFGIWQNLTNRVTAMDSPRYFQVTMTRGIFRSMQADHFFCSNEAGMTEMRNDFRFAAPLSILGLIAERLFLRSYMLNLLRERNAIIKKVAESAEWSKYIPEDLDAETGASR